MTASSEEFHLSDVLRTAIETTPSADPAAVAQAAFDAISRRNYAVALRQALGLLVPSYITGSRPTRRQGKKRAAAESSPSDTPTMTVHRFLASREFSPFRNAWIFLSEVTVEDAESIAQARYELADAMYAKGDWWTRVKKEIAQHGGTTFGDLPEAIVEDLMKADS